MRLIKRFLGFTFILVVVLGASGYFAMRMWPERSAEAMLMAYTTSAGLSPKSVQTDFGPVGYLEGGTGDQTVVMLHGLFARKEHWIDMSRQISDGYHVVILDLPGFGDNEILGKGAYTYANQVANIEAVLDAIGVQKFHLVGNSMGGQISGMLAEALPDRVMSVSFVGSPVGIDTPTKSRFETMMEKKSYTLVVHDMEEFADRNTLLFPQKPFVPQTIEQYWAKAEIAQAKEHERIWNEVNSSNRQPLQTIAPQIEQPALVAWCKEDEIFDFSGAQVLVDALKQGQMVTLSGCGHVPSLDAPTETGQAVRHFLDGL